MRSVSIGVNKFCKYKREVTNNGEKKKVVQDTHTHTQKKKKKFENR